MGPSPSRQQYTDKLLPYGPSELTPQLSPIQVSKLIQNPAAPDKVRSWGARYLNLVLTHLAPALADAEAARGGGGSGGEGGSEGGQARVQVSLEAARQGVEQVLGQDAAALLMRKVNLADRAAESKLEQLGQALSFFLPQE